MIISLAFIICFFGGPFILLGFFAYLWSRNKTERYKTVREYLNRGLPVPPELLRGQSTYAPPPATAAPHIYSYPVPTRPARRDLRRGITQTFAGFAICITFYLIWPHSRVWAWGLIPWIIGVGYIVAYFVEPEEDAAAQAPLPPVPTPGDSPTKPPSTIA